MKPPPSMRLAPLLLGAALLLVVMPSTTSGDEGTGGAYRLEMRNALSTIAAIIRAVADKLERHELRERQLGDQLRRGQQAVEKRQRASDAVLANMSLVLARVDERMRIMEASVTEGQQQTREQLQALAEGQEAAAAQLRECQAAAAEAQNALTRPGPRDGGGGGAAAAAEAKALAAELGARLDSVSLALNKAARGDAEAARTAATSLAAAEARVRAVAAETEGLLSRYEARLDSYRSPSRAVAEPDWHTLFLGALEAQGGAIRELRDRTAEASAALSELPAREELTAATNTTLEALEAARQMLVADSDKATQRLERAVEKSREESGRGRDEILEALNEQSEKADRIGDSMRAGYEEIHSQVLAHRGAEKVMIQTADNVLDTKRGVEYGVHQILLETGELVKTQAKLLNATLHQRFDGISDTILEHQTGSLTNLSTKIEAEISQVWRQIGIMYQQLTASATTLDRLQAQTDSYVNGSAAAMDSMEGKVGAIRERMNEVDENLNYLLGKLSLFSSEFGQVRTGLGQALDDIRKAFQDAQMAFREEGPGPNPGGAGAGGTHFYEAPPEE